MYLHDARLTQAIKRLYMLGNTKHRSKEAVAADEAVVGFGGSVGNMAAGQAADLKARQQQA